MCKLLGLNETIVSLALTKEHLDTSEDEGVIRHLTPREADSSRDAVSRALYSRLFNWLVARINVLLKTDSQQRYKLHRFKCILVVDKLRF